MYISHLFHKIVVTANITIIILFLPQRLTVLHAAHAMNPQRRSQLDTFDGRRQLAALGLTEKQMHMLRHNDVTVHAKVVTTANPFHDNNQDRAGIACRQLGLPSIATEGDEVRLPGFLKTLQPSRHAAKNTAPAAQLQEFDILNRTIRLIPRFAPTKGATWGTLTCGAPGIFCCHED
jgi:hypothetical protein